MKSRILCRKLSFLQRLLEEEATGVGAAAMKSLSDNVESLCLVKECRELESTYGTEDLLTDANCVSKCIIKKIIRGIDREKLVQKCSRKSPSIAGVVDRGRSWPKLCIWDPDTSLAFRTFTDSWVTMEEVQHPCSLCDLKDPQISIIDYIL